MERDSQQWNSVWRWLIILTDLIFANAALVGIWNLTGLHTLFDGVLLAWNASYVLAVLLAPPTAFHRSVRTEQVVTSAVTCVCWLIIIFYAIISRMHIMRMRFIYYLLFAIALVGIIATCRVLWYMVIRHWRFKGVDNIDVVFVGSGINLNELYNDMTDDTSMGYNVVGYFNDTPSEVFSADLTHLGGVADVIPWLQEHKVDYLFCNLSSRRAKEIHDIIHFCENNLIHFYSVPNVRNYVHNKMSVQFIGNSIVLTLRNEPMRTMSARIIKRAFDLVFSTLVIVLLLWWIILIVMVITKYTMPGPVFFRQKRNGQNGSEFYCLKFRTMVVNSAADEKQATKDDDRITKWGAFMRRTNLDELPQFINVFLGDMSVVGPRPHMLKHNVEYQRLINKYMVRSYCRPGITGWAQVTGSRGETKTVEEMEERIRKDIWYIENWTFMLDLRIIYLTIYNMLGGEKGNAY